MTSTASVSICKCCGLAGSEIKVNPCSCMFHVRCFPTSFFFEPNETEKCLRAERSCPACDCSTKTESIYLEPMKIEDVHRFHFREANNEQPREDVLLSLAPVFLMQSTDGAEIVVDEEIQIRNGRWTPEEIEFVERLMKMFNQGTLSIPNGISLNNFLRSIFLCKGTRLRKKIKNANFCTRLYDISHTSHTPSSCNEDSVSLSKLQNAFIQSIEVKDDRNLLSFSLKRMWSAHFFNFCVQVGFESINAKEWLDSIESIEKQVLAAKESKKQRERRCRVDSFALQTGNPDHPESNENINNFVGGQWHHDNNNSFSYSEYQGLPKQPPMVPFEIQQVSDDVEVMSDVSDSFVQPELSSAETKATALAPSTDFEDNADHRPAKRRRIEALVHPPGDNFDFSKFSGKIGDWSPFVRKIAAFIQTENLPFQYFDVWVASAVEGQKAKKSGHQIVMKHVGHSTRDDIESIWSLYHMNQFGKYSSGFAFNPGEGLPGRVLTSGLPTWDDSIQSSCTVTFPRVDGARSHGVKKGLGIPMFHTSLGQIVVAMYSVNDVPKDMNLVQKCCMYFQAFNPNPKWEVILDVGGVDHSKDLVLQDKDCNEEEEIANLLSKHASHKSGMVHSFMSLRLLLLQNPTKRASTENSSIEMLKASYRNYILSNKQEENIASLLVREWMLITSVDSVDYSPSTTLTVSSPSLQMQTPTTIPTESTANNASTTIQLSHVIY